MHLQSICPGSQKTPASSKSCEIRHYNSLNKKKKRREIVGNWFVLNLANVTQLCMENLQKRSGGQEPDPQTGFSCGNQA